MKILKEESFSLAKELVEFVNKRDIKKEDIMSITADPVWYVIFYYSEE